MSEIKGFDLSRLTQDENFGFHSFAIVEFEKCKDSKITEFVNNYKVKYNVCLLYTSPSPRDVEESRMPSSA